MTYRSNTQHQNQIKLRRTMKVKRRNIKLRDRRENKVQHLLLKVRLVMGNLNQLARHLIKRRRNFNSNQSSRQKETFERVLEYWLNRP